MEKARVDSLYERWLTLGGTITAELLEMADDDEQRYDRFYRDLAFGTGGLRGLIGAGTNRMNIYTVRKATLGLSRYLSDANPDARARGVVIAFDSRRMSEAFAQAAASVLGKTGFRVYVFESLRPTPELSFAVRHLAAAAGIVITASHNPKEYNGYKVYGADGVQILPDAAAAIQRAIGGFSDIDEVCFTDAGERRPEIIGRAIDDAYIHSLKETAAKRGVIQRPSDVRILYTPLHGAGNGPVRRILSECGFSDVSVVAAQALPDPEFSSVKTPNPEEPEAFAMALAQGETIKADLILATDPDADRLGVMAPDNGRYVYVTGNQLGCLMLDYILSHTNPQNAPFAVKTIVTTRMASEICQAYGVELIEVPTGFKYIGAMAERLRERDFVFGFEESCGYLTGDSARDKDAVCAALLTAEMAAWHKASGRTLCDALRDLYVKYGWFGECLKTVTCYGASGVEKISAAMEKLRACAPVSIGGLCVRASVDYLRNDSEYPRTDMLYFLLEHDGWLCMRPSGTEPKLKVYGGARGGDEQSMMDRLSALSHGAEELLDAYLR